MEPGDVNTVGNSHTSQSLTPPTSKRSHLDPGETGLWSYASTNKPVGIAQPFQKKESMEVEPMDTLQKQEDALTMEQGDGLKTGLELNIKGKSDLKGRDMTPKDLGSNVERGRKLSGKRHSSADSDSDSDSSSSFSYPFEPPSESSDDAGLAGKDRGEHGIVSAAIGRSPGETGGRKKEAVDSQILALPSGKRYHLFVSHSTSDQQWARDSVVSQLGASFRVKACYQLMPNKSCYNDAGIKDCMKQSCVVLIGLSPAYLISGRCQKEWQMAVHLSPRWVNIVVASVSLCSRPEPLKSFLYLDLKKEKAWEMLLQAIRDTVHKSKVAKTTTRQLSPSLKQSAAHSHSSNQSSSHAHELRQSPSSSLPSKPSLSPTYHLAEPAGQSADRSSSPEQESQGSSDALCSSQEEAEQMMAGFEALFDEVGGTYEGSGMASENLTRRKVLDDEVTHENLSSGSNDPSNTLTKSCDQSVPSNDHICDSVVESSEIDEHHRRSVDVEEGEVSDSSEEVAKANSQSTSDSGPSEVASFYDNLARPDADKRNESPIKLMRNFNNWVKSVLIRSYLKHCPVGCTALDICCGKGGDLLKWKEGKIEHLVCADISSESIAAAKDRYRSEKMIGKGRRPPFSAEFYVADCTGDRLSDLYSSQLFFHISSCQFSIHYSFESYDKAHMMLRNACENLRPGGYFIGTTIDADQLVHRLRTTGTSENGSLSFGNELLTVTLDPSLDVNNLPLFGARYNFRLHGVVDLPEYLIYFPLLVKMLEDFEMELLFRQNFYDFFEEHRYNSDDSDLMYRMEAFDKAHGTMSREQWEAVGLYLVYVFKKKLR